MFKLRFSKKLEKTMKKLDKNLDSALKKKIKQIISCDKTTIQHFKNLRGELSHLKRVHVGSYVLTFQVREDIIIFEDFVHHDKAY